MVRIVIHCDGGIIQNISTDEPVEIYVVDYDIDGVEDDHPMLTRFAGDNCLLSPFEPEINPGIVHLAVKTWETV